MWQSLSTITITHVRPSVWMMTEGEPLGWKRREREREMMCQSLNLKPPTAGWQPEGNRAPLLLHIQLSERHLAFFPSSLERCSPQGSAVALEMNAAEQACLRVGLLSPPWLKIIIFHHTGENWIHVFNNTVRAVLLHVWLDNVTYFTDKAGTWISHTGNQTSASLPQRGCC